MFYRKIKCNDDHQPKLCLPMHNMEEKFNKDTKFDHYNITNLTEQYIQSSFHSALEIC